MILDMPGSSWGVPSSEETSGVILAEIGRNRLLDRMPDGSSASGDGTVKTSVGVGSFGDGV